MTNHRPISELCRPCVGRCGTRIAWNELACPACWARVPKRLQHRYLASRADRNLIKRGKVVRRIAWGLREGSWGSP